jgi:hypothetical protein
MKTAVKFFLLSFILTAAVACSTGESAALKEARQIQDNILKGRAALDSTIDVSIAGLNEKLSAMSADSVAMADSSVRASFEAMQSRVSSLATSKSKIADWVTNLKTLPSAEDLAGGAENPFGAEAKEDDILTALKASEEEFNSLKTSIEAEINQ